MRVKVTLFSMLMLFAHAVFAEDSSVQFVNNTNNSISFLPANIKGYTTPELLTLKQPGERSQFFNKSSNWILRHKWPDPDYIRQMEVLYNDPKSPGLGVSCGQIDNHEISGSQKYVYSVTRCDKSGALQVTISPE